LSVGLPSGVLSIAHGGVDTVNYLCDHPQIKAISFVGSDHAGKHIYSRAGANGKRVQANLGAKSGSIPFVLSVDLHVTLFFYLWFGCADHCVVMPDASKNLTLNSIAGAAFGGRFPLDFNDAHHKKLLLFFLIPTNQHTCVF
jgi:malonate-semialdehyde dehydrogenase (acetylating)/methylmalonate-semialdehyde dehydrogenase